MGDTVGHWSLVAECLNVHRIEPSIAPEMNVFGVVLCVNMPKFHMKAAYICVYSNKSVAYYIMQSSPPVVGMVVTK